MWAKPLRTTNCDQLCLLLLRFFTLCLVLSTPRAMAARKQLTRIAISRTISQATIQTAYQAWPQRPDDFFIRKPRLYDFPVQDVVNHKTKNLSLRCVGNHPSMTSELRDFVRSLPTFEFRILSTICEVTKLKLPWCSQKASPQTWTRALSL